MSIARGTADRPRAEFLGLASGIAVLVAITVCCAIAVAAGTPLDPGLRPLAAPSVSVAVPFGAVQVLAFGAYVAGLWIARRHAIRTTPVLVLAVAIQLVPLIAPLLMSTDAWFYSNSGRIGAIHGGNPYVDLPNSFDDASLVLVPPEWRVITTPYGPLFSLFAYAVATIAGDSLATAELLFRVAAALSVIAIVVIVSRIAANGSFAAAFVGWNPLVALTFAGAGHNDALMMLFVVGAIALADRRPQLAGSAWAAALFIKVVPLVLVPLYLIERRALGRPTGIWGMAAGLAGLAAVATVVYGVEWVSILGAILGVANRPSSGGAASATLGAPRMALFLLVVAAFAVGYVALVRRAATGLARLGIAATMLLFAVLVSPQTLWPWYLIWAIPLVALDDERWSQLAVLALCAYQLNFLGDAGSLISHLR